MILTRNICFHNIKIKLNSRSWMTLKSSVVIFQNLEPLQPQWHLQPQQPPWPQWHLQPHFFKKNTDPWLKMTLSKAVETSQCYFFENRIHLFFQAHHHSHNFLQKNQIWEQFVSDNVRNEVDLLKSRTNIAETMLTKKTKLFGFGIFFVNTVSVMLVWFLNKSTPFQTLSKTHCSQIWIFFRNSDNLNITFPSE